MHLPQQGQVSQRAPWVPFNQKRPFLSTEPVQLWTIIYHNGFISDPPPAVLDEWAADMASIYVAMISLVFCSSLWLGLIGLAHLM